METLIYNILINILNFFVVPALEFTPLTLVNKFISCMKKRTVIAIA